MIFMKVTLLGTGTSFPDRTRVQSGILIEVDDYKILLDVGSGILQRLNHSNVDINCISAVFISHFHIDHCSDFHTLVQSLWLSGYKDTLEVFGSPAYREWARGTNEIAFPYLLTKIPINYKGLAENEAIQHKSLTVSVCPTLHGSMDGRAFRVEHDGKSVVFSSDTAPCPEVINLAKGCDILIHECNWLDGIHPEGVHTSPSELRDIVEQVQPKKVILNHVSPEVVNQTDKVISTIVRRTDAEVVMGEDLMSFELK